MMLRECENYGRKMKAACLLMIVALLLVTVMTARARTTNFDQDKFDDLYHEMDVMFRQLHGCPPTGWPPAIECVAGLGRFDVVQWKRVSDRGERLFEKGRAR